MYTIQNCPARTRSAIVSAVAAAVSALVAPTSVRAQTVHTSRLEGRVTDSVHAGPLAGAAVLAVRLSPEPHLFLSAIADAEGRFHFDSLAGGKYAISFSSPLLDSLDLVIPERAVNVEEGGRMRVELASPSAATLRAAACPGLHLPAGQGGVVGLVTDAANDRPLAGATVAVGWGELIVDKVTARASMQTRTGAAITDTLGQYRLCGVPTDQVLQLQVQRGVASGAIVDLIVNDSVGMMRRDLSYAEEVVTRVAARGDTDAVNAVRLAATTGTAVVTGVVLGPQDRPIPDAEVRVAGARPTARSDSSGHFTLSGLPAGTRMLEARRIGYSMSRAPVELRSDRTISQTMRLTRVVSLDSIRIVAQRTRYPEFQRHRKSGWGRFLEESDIVRRNPFNTSDLVRMMPGFRVSGFGPDEVVLSSRGGMFGGGGCKVNVVIDGMPNMDINMVHPSDIAAMEAYSSIAGVPPEYSMGSHCGAIIIWTKR